MEDVEHWFKVYKEIGSKLRELEGTIGVDIVKLHREYFDKFISKIQSDAHAQGLKDGAEIADNTKVNLDQIRAQRDIVANILAKLTQSQTKEK